MYIYIHLIFLLGYDMIYLTGKFDLPRKELNRMTGMMIIWLVLFIIFAAAEAATLQLVSIWFAAGALVAFVLTIFGVPAYIQGLTCLIVAGVMIAVTRPLIKKIMPAKTAKTNSDANVGRTAVIIEAVDPETSSGRVRLDGVDWIAVSADGKPIANGSAVKITAVEGAKLIVIPERIPAEKE